MNGPAGRGGSSEGGPAGGVGPPSLHAVEPGIGQAVEMSFPWPRASGASLNHPIKP
jgi:hypothetical protein